MIREYLDEGGDNNKFKEYDMLTPNANEIVKEVDKLMEEISKDLPKGLVMADLMSTKGRSDKYAVTVHCAHSSGNRLA